MTLLTRAFAAVLCTLPAIGALAQAPAVVVQLHSTTGTCWAQTYTAPASPNDGGQFKDKP